MVDVTSVVPSSERTVGDVSPTALPTTTNALRGAAPELLYPLPDSVSRSPSNTVAMAASFTVILAFAQGLP